MIKILRSERIKSLQIYAQAKGDVIRGYDNYKKIREAQIKRYHEKEELKITEIIEEDEDAENERFWKQKSYHTPEDRIAIAEHTLKAEEKKHGISDEKKKQKYVPKLFSPSGKPYNMNHPKVPFTLNDEDDQDNVILDVGVYRYLDTSYIDVDIQPTYVRVTIKGKILQLTLPCEILVDKSSAKRNVTTGSLVITMPRLHPSMMLHGTSITSRTTKNENPTRKDNAVISIKNQMFTSTREFLEIGPSRIDSELDFSKIFENSRKKVDRKLTVDQIKEKAMPDDFIDNPEVPPLE
ncbi:dynein axonemal assembly factor 11-like isoform X2 [Vespa crabro]|nr:dynein axonemal assembly factor 11-like isoform X2 [Vespa crabro]